MDVDQTRSSALIQNISHLYYNEGNVQNDWDNPLVLATYYMTYKIGKFLLATFACSHCTGPTLGSVQGTRLSQLETIGPV